MAQEGCDGIGQEGSKRAKKRSVTKGIGSSWHPPHGTANPAKPRRTRQSQKARPGLGGAERQGRRREDRREKRKHSMPWLTGETKNIYEYFNLYVFDTADLLHRKSFHPENKHQRDSQLSFQNRTREIYSSAFWPE